MRGVKDSIEDYIFHFRMKDTKGKIGEIRKMIISTAVIGTLICTPWIVVHVHSRVSRHLYQTNLQDLSEAQRWERVRDGLDRIDCDDNAADELEKQGIDLSTQEGLEYGVKNGWCVFALNDTQPPATKHLIFQ